MFTFIYIFGITVNSQYMYTYLLTYIMLYICRIAVNSQYVTTILGIKNPIHRQKLSVKATDLVLFGYKKSKFYVTRQVRS